MELVSLKYTCRRLSIGRTLLWELMKQPGFPVPVMVSTSRKAFLATELDAWIAARAAARPQRVA